MKKTIVLSAVIVAALILAASCSNLLSSPRAQGGKKTVVTVTVTGAPAGSGASKGLIGDGSVGSVSIVVKDSDGVAIGPGGNLTKGVSYWSGAIDVGTYTGLATFYATAKNGSSVPIYSGWNTVTLTGSGDLVSIAVTALGGLVGEWLFNENTSDTSGKGNGGTASTPAYAPDRFGRANSAYSFDGSNEAVIDCGNGTSLDLASAMTIACWVKSSSSGEMCLVGKWNGGISSDDPQAYGCLVSSDGGKLRSLVNDANNTVDNSNDGNGSVVDGKWHFCVLIADKGLSTKQIKMYIDGTIDSEFDATANIIKVTTSHLILGCLSPGEGYARKYTGLLDDVRIYGRALTVAEISDLYHEGGWASTLTGPGSMVGEWLFSGNMNDTSGTGNNGAASGAVYAADRFGNASGAYSFDGSNGAVIDCGNDPSVNLSSSFTMAAWVKTTQTSSGGLISKWNPGYVNESQAYNLGIGSGTLQCSINDTSGGDNTHGGTGAVNDGSWRFCLLSFNTALPSKQIKMYIDGALDSEFDDSSPNILITSSHLFLGCLAPDDGYNQKYTGLLDDVRIFGRALTLTEIGDLYHEGGWATGAPSTDFHLVGYYGGHQYWVSNATANWQDAKTACEAVGGHLATIGSSGENDFATLAAQYVGSDCGGLWIGLTDAAVEGTFVWVTAESLSYTNWYPGEPNNDGDQDYAVMQCPASGKTVGQWDDAQGTVLFRYLLEIE